MKFKGTIHFIYQKTQRIWILEKIKEPPLRWLDNIETFNVFYFYRFREKGVDDKWFFNICTIKIIVSNKNPDGNIFIRSVEGDS